MSMPRVDWLRRLWHNFINYSRTVQDISMRLSPMFLLSLCLGTRFESKVCGSPEEIERSVRLAKETTADLQRKATVPVRATN
jgi:hypothetical protein